jgi:serine-type D-Ala-D-Ala carboxypeptidase (penicillin-binding protein 5/6)
VRRFAAALLVAACCLGGTTSATASPPQLGARAWLVKNPVTGEVLASHDESTPMPIASITKLMTVLVVLDHHRLSDVVRVDPQGGADPVGQRRRLRARALGRA